MLKAAFNEAINIHEIEIKNPFTGIQMFPVDIKTKYIPPHCCPKQFEFDVLK
jgi:hypothetical protein